MLLHLALQDIAALLSRGASEAQREMAAVKQQQINLKLEAGRLTRYSSCKRLLPPHAATMHLNSV
jgi:hypothetical protein